MGRSKKAAPPQSAEDVELAEQTIAAAFGDTVERHRTELEKAQEEVLRLQRKVAVAEERRAAWADRGEIDQDRAVDAWQFSARDMRALALRFPHSPPAAAEVAAARRQHEVVERYLADLDVLPAALTDPNWRTSR